MDSKDVIDKSDGVSQRAIRKMRALVIGPMDRDKTPTQSLLEKGSGETGESKRLPDDPFMTLLGQGMVLLPPFDLLTLAMLPEQSTELNQCIEAMEVNIEGFGHRFVPRIDVDDEDTPPELVKRVKAERVRLENFFAYANIEDSFTKMRRKRRRDLETTGSAYWEIIRGLKGEIQGFEYIPSYQVRLSKIDKEVTPVNVPILALQEDGSVKIDKIPRFRRFRKLIQTRMVHNTTTHQVSDYKMVFFKEFGDPRVMDNQTGQIISEEKQKNFDGRGNPMPESRKANELARWTIFSSRSPYGIPRYIGNLLSIFGDRKAEEINFVTFENNCVPSMMILVSNGQLTQGSIDRIEDFVETQIRGQDNWSRFLIVEAEGEDQDGEDAGVSKIHVERLRDQQQEDALFQNYSANNQDKIRRAFRLPPILVGRCHSADTEYLTSDGWKIFNDVVAGDSLATQDLKTGNIEYQQYTHRYEYDYDGELIHLKNNGVDALVTPNHRMVVRVAAASKTKTKSWELIEAQNFSELKGKNGGRVELPTSSCIERPCVSSFTIPAGSRQNGRKAGSPTKNKARDKERLCRAEEKYAARDVSMDTFCTFLGYFISEGSTTAKSPNVITLSQNVGPVAEHMVSIVREMGFEPSVTISRENQMKIDFSHNGLWKWLRNNCGTNSVNKRLPQKMLMLSCYQQKLVLDALIAGDGSAQKLGSQGSFTYSTTSKKLNDQLHILCLNIGISLTSRCVERSEECWRDIYCSYGHVARKHTLHVVDQMKKVNYCGKVACFTVPNGTLITRRNGRVLISGNSELYNRATAETSRKLADEQVFAPERTDFDGWVNRCLFPDMGVIYHTYKSNSPNTTDNLDLVKILAGGEKTGGLTPRIARGLLADILGDQELPDFPEGFDPDIPFSLTMAEAVKNKADPTEPGQQVTSIKNQIDVLKGMLEDVVEEFRSSKEEE